MDIFVKITKNCKLNQVSFYSIFCYVLSWQINRKLSIEVSGLILLSWQIKLKLGGSYVKYNPYNTQNSSCFGHTLVLH